LGPRRQFGLAVLAFEGAAAIKQGQPGDDGLLVAADAAGKKVKCGWLPASTG
jgi:hypothetical protein